MENNLGLADCVALDSSICFLDGENSILSYRGMKVQDLIGIHPFESVMYLLLYGEMPDASQIQELRTKLSQYSCLPDTVFQMMKMFPKESHPMSVLRTVVSMLGVLQNSPSPLDADKDYFLDASIQLVAKIPVIIAMWHNLCLGKPLVIIQSGSDDFNFSRSFLHMLLGEMPDSCSIDGMEAYLIALADHELNASTFAMRISASTLSDYYSAITTAIGTLKGPLHGGANERVLSMLQDIQSTDCADAYLDNAFATKQKIMGFGHRVYKKMDIRSVILKRYARKLCDLKHQSDLFALSEYIEKVIQKKKSLLSNVDFYSASLLHAMGISKSLFTPIFVASRIVGYSAHYLEQITSNRIIRPRANYIGEL